MIAPSGTSRLLGHDYFVDGGDPFLRYKTVINVESRLLLPSPEMRRNFKRGRREPDSAMVRTHETELTPETVNERLVRRSAIAIKVRMTVEVADHDRRLRLDERSVDIEPLGDRFHVRRIAMRPDPSLTVRIFK